MFLKHVFILSINFTYQISINAFNTLILEKSFQIYKSDTWNPS